MTGSRAVDHILLERVDAQLRARQCRRQRIHDCVGVRHAVPDTAGVRDQDHAVVVGQAGQLLESLQGHDHARLLEVDAPVRRLSGPTPATVTSIGWLL